MPYNLGNKHGRFEQILFLHVQNNCFTTLAHILESINLTGHQMSPQQFDHKLLLDGRTDKASVPLYIPCTESIRPAPEQTNNGAIS